VKTRFAQSKEEARYEHGTQTAGRPNPADICKGRGGDPRAGGGRKRTGTGSICKKRDYAHHCVYSSAGDLFVPIFQSSRGDKPLVETAREHFGDRCFVDPNDGSEATLGALARDQNRAFSGRGNHGEWNIYEIWSSNNARRWTEGFKQELAKRGYAYDPETVTMETFGSWSGCHHKYSNFFPTYLGMTKPAYIHGEMEYCTLKGMPMDVGEFVGEHVLDRGVVLTLFRRTDGCPMAQFWDGLRPIWDRPHMATVRIAPGSVELFNFSPNSFIKPAGEARKLSDGFIADVGDGCRPEYTTVVGRSPKDADFETFCEAMRNAVIEPIPGPAQVFYMVEV